VHVMPEWVETLREREMEGGWILVRVSGNAEGGYACSCEGECFGHPWHHFVCYRVSGDPLDVSRRLSGLPTTEVAHAR